MELLDTLKKLREKLLLIETETETTSKEPENLKANKANSKNNDERMKEKIDNLIKLQQKDQKVVINAGGKRFITTRHTIENAKYFNIFSEMISSQHLIDGEIFYDCSQKLFSYVLGVIRSFQHNGTEYSHTNRYKLFLDSDCDDEVLKQIIKDIFPAEFDLLLHEIDLRYLKDVKETPATTVNPILQPPEPNNDDDYGRNYDY